MRKDAEGKLSSDVLYEEYRKRRREEREEATNKGNATENSKDTPNRKNAFESIAEMDLEQYCKSGWSDRIGLEKVSQSKKDDFTGINPCRKWPCEYGRTCKFLHIPTGKRIKQS